MAVDNLPWRQDLSVGHESIDAMANTTISRHSGRKASTAWQHRTRGTLVHMANLTLVIDEDVLRRARVRAAQDGTSVNAEVRDYLTGYANGAETVAERRRRAMARLIKLADSMPDVGGLEGRTWTRDDLYDRSL